MELDFGKRSGWDKMMRSISFESQELKDIDLKEAGE